LGCIPRHIEIVGKKNMYNIVNCPSCGNIIMANTAHRTKTCPHCGSKAKLINLKILAKTKSSHEAVKIIQYLKEKKSKEPNRVTFKKFKV
jgi:ABC-type ATPase with predicted acetyltransferase domain